MVSKITIFEPHIENAQFGPSMVSDQDDSDPSDAAVTEAQMGPSLARGIVGVGILMSMLIVGAAAIRRRRNATRDALAAGYEGDIEAPSAEEMEAA